MKINVTQDHIDRGVKVDCFFCPVALALSETTKRNDLQVSTHYVFKSPGLRIVALPEEVTKWIYNFDEYSPEFGYKPKPFSFEIEFPNEQN